MKLTSASLLAIAAVCLAVPAPVFAQSGTALQSSQDPNASMPGQQEAMKMVPARAALKETLNAKKTQTGSMFHATLAHKVKLDNGPELPSGTVLTGTIGTDDMQSGGTSKLVLRFTTATLKSGQVVPIKATIVSIDKPEAGDDYDHPVVAGEQMPNSWTDGTLKVEQPNVVSGVDLHSAIASKNSGVFTSNKGKNVELRAGSEIELAIAQAHNSQQSGASAGMNQ